MEKFGRQLVTFIVSLILARILSPKEFGLIGMIAVFSALGQTIIDSGFGAALIQRKKITHIDESSVFYLNLLLGALMTALLFFSANFIAEFYNEPQLVLITKIISFNLLIGSFAAVPNNLLSKELDFKTQAKVTLLSSIISGFVGVYMAYNGYGVMALVIQIIVATFFKSVFMFVFSKWYPQLKFSLNSLKGLFGFGSKLLMSGILNTVFTNLYNLIIGKLFSAAALGFYNRSNEFYLLTISNTVGVIGKIVYPVLSKVQDDNERFVKVFSRGLKMLAFVTLPVMFGILAVADNLIIFLLTDKWIESVPYLRVLMLMGAMLPISVMNLQALNAKGRSDLFLKLEIIKKIIMALSIYFSYKYGITIMLLSHFAFVSFPSVILNSIYSGHIFNYGIIKQVKQIYKILIISIIMMVATYYLGQVINLGITITLFIQIAVAGILYVGLSYLFEKKFMLSMKDDFTQFSK